MVHILRVQDLERNITADTGHCLKCNEVSWLPVLKGEKLSHCFECSQELLETSYKDKKELEIELSKLKKIYDLAKFKVN